MGLPSLKNQALKLRDFFIDLIFPRECLDCSMEGEWLCARCLAKLNFKSEQHCLGCKAPNFWGNFCLNCQPNYSLSGIWIAGDYENQVLARLIKVLKYHFAKEIAFVLGSFLTTFLNELKIQAEASQTGFRPDHAAWHVIKQTADSLIVPVPLHPKRWRWRGFNQAEEIAKIIAANFNLTINGLDLKRIKHNRPQVQLTEAARLVNVKNSFGWRGQTLSGQPIILIDDIVTTGATLDECAKILKQNGAGPIWGLVVAKG